ncbi:restriction endonuclease subunit S [Burkholderia pseudomallei]|uniref:restriction endonuclease subunit S n=1 Tax=Burkholderia pseudomallei TaxID=28450 RepID=UPI00068A2228|nr:restriction endonuclease subunit S [Burkholderia pseudomallei]
MQEDNLLSLSYGRIVRKDIESNDGLLPESFETYQIIRPGDIVLRLTDLQNDKRSLRSAIVKEQGIITSAYLAIQPTKVEPSFLAYLLRAYDLTKVFYSMGGGLRQSMKFTDMKRMPMVVPNADEQNAIAAFLDRETIKIDALIAEQEKLLALLAEKRLATISHTVTQGLNPKAPMKDSGVAWLGDVPAHWDVTRLKFVASVQTGIAKGKDTTGKETVTVPYLRVANVQDGFLALDDIATIDIEPEQLDRYRLQAGDVLMNEGGDFDKLGRGAIWHGQIQDCIHQNHVFAVRPHGVDARWLNQITSSQYAQYYFMGRSKQSTNLASISSSNIMELPVLMPPTQEQGAILAFIDAETSKLDNLKAEAERTIDLLKERRSALIAAAVTGKIDVRGVMVQNTNNNEELAA